VRLKFEAGDGSKKWSRERGMGCSHNLLYRLLVLYHAIWQRQCDRDSYGIGKDVNVYQPLQTRSSVFTWVPSSIVCRVKSISGTGFLFRTARIALSKACASGAERDLTGSSSMMKCGDGMGEGRCKGQPARLARIGGREKAATEKCRRQMNCQRRRRVMARRKARWIEGRVYTSAE
jgi:hypothetical protein